MPLRSGGLSRAPAPVKAPRRCQDQPVSSKKKPAYQDVPDSSIRVDAWRRGYLTALEFLRIQAWKSANGSLAQLTLYTESEFEDVTKGVMAVISRWRTMGAPAPQDNGGWAQWKVDAGKALDGDNSSPGLCWFTGLRHARASAILAFLDPDTWPIIDRHAIRVVFGAASRTQDHPYEKVSNRIDVYESYARQLVTAGRAAWDSNPPTMSIHDLDQRAMNVGKDQKTELRARSVDGITPVAGLPATWTFLPVP